MAPRLRLIGFALLAVSISHGAGAQTCGAMSRNIDDARSQLSRAGKTANLEEAKNSARRARSELDNAQVAAIDCKCPQAAMEFGDAETHARRARDSTTADGLADELKQAARNLDSALAAVGECSGSGGTKEK
jgi:hypothetical protein